IRISVLQRYSEKTPNIRLIKAENHSARQKNEKTCPRAKTQRRQERQTAKNPASDVLIQGGVPKVRLFSASQRLCATKGFSLATIQPQASNSSARSRCPAARPSPPEGSPPAPRR